MRRILRDLMETIEANEVNEEAFVPFVSFCRNERQCFVVFVFSAFSAVNNPPCQWPAVQVADIAPGCGARLASHSFLGGQFESFVSTCSRFIGVRGWISD